MQLWSPSLNAAGLPLVPDEVPVKPKLTDEPAVTFAFQFTFFAVTVAPDWVGLGVPELGDGLAVREGPAE